MISMAQVVEWKTGIPKAQGSHLTLQHFEVVCCWAWFTFNIKLLFIARECDGEDGRAVNSETGKVVGSTPTWVKFWCFFIFFHSHIHKI
jgi:hypothetical protein